MARVIPDKQINQDADLDAMDFIFDDVDDDTLNDIKDNLYRSRKVKTKVDSSKDIEKNDDKARETIRKSRHDAREKIKPLLMKSMFAGTGSFRHEPFPDASKYAWNVGEIPGGGIKTGNGLFDSFLKFSKVDWWLDQALLLIPNLVNLGLYFHEKKKSEKSKDKYIANLSFLGRDVKNLKDLADVEKFQKAANELKKKKDKKSYQERLQILYHVADRYGGKSRQTKKLRQLIVTNAMEGTDLLAKFKANAEAVREAGVNDPSVADLMTRYDSQTKKWNFQDKDYSHIVQNIKLLEKAYPYNDPEKYKEKVRQIMEKNKNDPYQLMKDLDKFAKAHNAASFIEKDKKGKEKKIIPADIDTRPAVEQAVYKDLSANQIKEFMSNMAYMETFFGISGKEPDGTPQRTADDANIAAEEAWASAHDGNLSPVLQAQKDEREKRFIKNKEGTVWSMYDRVLRDDLKIQPKDLKKLDWGELDKVKENLYKEFRK
ncbi:MAG: hypothetical protein LBR35_01410, partial [Rickettsiales bacterium]|nr:hypothetical protein [Rickettsiales bacterium]